MNKFKLAVAAVAALNFSAAPAGAAGDWIWPVRGDVITKYSNAGGPYSAGQHRGIDVSAPVDTPVVAAAAGTVTYAGGLGASGLVVAVRTADGQFATSYLHLSRAAVQAGDAVAAGEQIGAVGTSGLRSAAAPHLHFGVREAGSRNAYRDPLTLLGPLPGPRPDSSPRPVPAPAPAPQPAPPAPTAIPGLAALPALGAAPAPVDAGRVGTALGSHAGRQAHTPRATSGAPAVAGMARLGPVGTPPPSGAPSRLRKAPRHEARVRTAPSGASRLETLGSGPASHAAPPARRRTGALQAPKGDGVDIGWLVACIGLVGAAGALGRAGKGRPRTPRAGVAVARLRGSHGP